MTKNKPESDKLNGVRVQMKDGHVYEYIDGKLIKVH